MERSWMTRLLSACAVLCSVLMVHGSTESSVVLPVPHPELLHHNPDHSRDSAVQARGIGEEGGLGLRGPPGPRGSPGARGLPGERGMQGKIGTPGTRGTRGGRGYDGPPGPPGKRGRTGTQGEQGPRGAEGPEGPKGRTGRTGKRGPRGTQGPQGDQGPAGPPGNTGPRGHPGPRGRMGESGPEGVAGKPGHTGKPGAVGIQGPRGPRGPQGHRGRPGLRGYDGSLKKYHLDGPNRFMLTGGSGDALSAKIFTGQENKAPVLYLESQDAPVSIQMYQSRKRSHVAGIFGYYGNVGIGVSKPKAKLHVQGQIMMSHNFNNVLVSREKRRVGSLLQEYQFDLIGTYWGMDRSAVYIGGFTGPEKPYHHAEKVVFGGSSQNKDGKASIDLLKGTVSATAFLTQQLVQHDENEMDELEAEMLLDMSSNTNEMSRHIDLGRSSHYLHRTVKSQAKMIADLQSQLSELTRKFKQLQQRVRDE